MVRINLRFLINTQQNIIITDMLDKALYYIAVNATNVSISTISNGVTGKRLDKKQP